MLIDRQLVDAGWAVQDKKQLNLFAASVTATEFLAELSPDVSPLRLSGGNGHVTGGCAWPH